MEILFRHRMKTKHLYKQLESFLNNETKTNISIKQIQDFIIKNSKNLLAYERSWTRELIDFINPKHQEVDTLEFLRVIKEKRKQSHAKQAAWYIKLFKTLGCRYSYFAIYILLLFGQF